MPRYSARCVTELDRLIGARIRSQREQIGLSQQQLARKLEVSFQQLQKYENGSNRVSAARLMEVSEILGSPITSFFDQADVAPDPNAKSAMQIRELTAAFANIHNEKFREAFLETVKAAASLRPDGASPND